MNVRDWIQILMAGLSSVGFALIFQLHGSKLITIGCGGALSWFVFLLGKAHGFAMAGFFGAVVAAAAIAEIEARRRKTPVLVMEVPLLVPLIPGGDLYRMVVSIMQNGIRASVDLMVWLIQEVFLIAAGVILVSTIAVLYVRICALLRAKLGR